MQSSTSAPSRWQALIPFMPFVLWGSGMVVMKGPLGEASPMFIATMRLLPAGIIVLAAMWFAQTWLGFEQRSLVPQGWKAWAWVIAFGIVDGALFEGFLIEGLQDTGAGLGSVLIDTQPIAVAVMAAAFYGEHIGGLGWLAMLTGVLGIVTIGIAPEWGPNGLLLSDIAVSTGTVLMLLAALSMAVATVMMRQIQKYVDPIVATGWHMLVGSVPLILWSLQTETHQWDRLAPSAWWGVAYIAMFTSALAYALFFYCASRENLTQFSSLTFLTPVFALLLGSIFLQETLTNVQWAGVLVTLASVYCIHQRESLTNRLLSWGQQETEEIAADDTAKTEPHADDLVPKPVEIGR
ncbi:MAG: DMT family transporter [Synechococcus sp.]